MSKTVYKLLSGQSEAIKSHKDGGRKTPSLFDTDQGLIIVTHGSSDGSFLHERVIKRILKLDPTARLTCCFPGAIAKRNPEIKDQIITPHDVGEDGKVWTWVIEGNLIIETSGRACKQAYNDLTIIVE